VTMILKDSHGLQVVERGVSPDIIAASVSAFEKGFNEFSFQRRKKL
jgi:hypothetical protein